MCNIVRSVTEWRIVVGRSTGQVLVFVCDLLDREFENQNFFVVTRPWCTTGHVIFFLQMLEWGNCFKNELLIIWHTSWTLTTNGLLFIIFSHKAIPYWMMISIYQKKCWMMISWCIMMCSLDCEMRWRIDGGKGICLQYPKSYS